jgi:hypothetical protein
MNKFNELTRQFMDWWSAPETPAPSAPATSTAAATPAADASSATSAADAPAADTPAADAPERPAPRWKALPRTRADRFYPQVVELPDAQGYVALRFYMSECRRTLMSPRRLPLPQTACLPGPLFALEETTLAYADAGQDQAEQSMPRGFRYELPPILYSSAQEMGVILQQTHQEVRRLLENHHIPALRREAPALEETVDPLPPVPPEWLDAPPMEVPEGPLMEGPEGPSMERPEGPFMEGPEGPSMEGPEGPPAELEEQRAAPVRKAEGKAPGPKQPLGEWKGVIVQWLPGEDKDAKAGKSSTPLLHIRDEAKDGEITTIRGADLRRAMVESKAQAGDRVSVQHQKNKPVEVFQNGKRKPGAYMKIFEIQVLEQRMPGR